MQLKRKGEGDAQGSRREIGWYEILLPETFPGLMTGRVNAAFQIEAMSDLETDKLKRLVRKVLAFGPIC